MWCYLDTHDPVQAKYINFYTSAMRYHVGFFTPDGRFVWHNCYESWAEAECRVHYLNGGN